MSSLNSAHNENEDNNEPSTSNTSLNKDKLCQVEQNKSVEKPKHQTPVQDSVSKEILILECELQTLKVKQNANLLTEEEEKDLKKKTKLLEEKQIKLTKLKKNQERPLKKKI